MEEFERLLEECRRSVERFIKYKIGNRSDAEDILQDVYMSAYQKFASLRNKSSFQAWILSIARNKCSDYYRRMAENMSIPCLLYTSTYLRQTAYLQDISKRKEKQNGNA